MIVRIPHIHSFIQQIFIEVPRTRDTVWNEDMEPAPQMPL